MFGNIITGRNMKVGFIGTGIMGSRMAHNLLNNNYSLIVNNRTKEKAESLLKAGAEWADSPLDVGTEADIIFTMLSNPEAVYEVSLGEEGFLSGMKEDSLWVDCSTVNPTFSREMAKKADECHVRFMDAPVAGTKQPAEKGELIFFAGGNQKDFEEVKPLLEKMGKKIVHMGECGKGTSMKMVVNLMLGVAMASFSEALVLGEALGFDKETIFNTLLGGPVTAPFLTAKKEKFAEDKYETEFPLQWMHKDLTLVSDTADETDITLPTASAVKEVFSMAKQKGFGELDFSALYRFLSKKD
jgi:3-hydroxyisobutyrate dehydrogenase-like beta-hydroxyacid dehydrogenase